MIQLFPFLRRHGQNIIADAFQFGSAVIVGHVLTEAGDGVAQAVQAEVSAMNEIPELRHISRLHLPLHFLRLWHKHHRVNLLDQFAANEVFIPHIVAVLALTVQLEESTSGNRSLSSAMSSSWPYQRHSPFGSALKT